MKCKRCNRQTTKEDICQLCKDELLGFFEVTNDWNLALDMEIGQSSLFRIENFENDFTSGD